jgi:NAD(P)-dependent dehydrogenase (short-subunit alcohol dehydrogenase family)
MASDRRVALVTGSTTGIGLAIARRLASDGYEIAFHSRSSAAAGRALAAELPGASYTGADLADPAQARRLIADVLAQHGRLDVLVNNAGAVARFPHADLKAATPEVWRQMMDVNVIGPWLLIAEAEQALRQSAASGRPACVVNIGTHAAVRPKGSSIPYAASKAALHHASRLLALTLGPAIRVNVVAPGLVDTAMSTGWQEAYDLWNTRSPMRRAAKPDDIAGMVAALVANDYVTGEVVIVDGGLNLT